MLASETRKKARGLLNKKWNKAALIMLIYMLLVSVISFVVSNLPFASIVQVLLDVPIAFGLVSTYMKLKKGEEVSYVGFLTDGFNNFSEAWKVALWTSVKLIIPIIIIFVSCVVLIIGIFTTVYNASVVSANSADVIKAGELLVVGSILVLLASIIWFETKSYYYRLTSFILFDNPNMDPKEIVEKSKELMTNNRFKLFCLELSFTGWIILALLTFGIGVLWLTPYMLLAQIVFYEHLLEDNKEDNKEMEN